MSDDGPKVPRFAIVGIAIIGLIVLARRVGVPELASTTCAMVNWGCSVQGQLSAPSESQTFMGAGTPNNRPTRPGGFALAQPQSPLCQGRPKGIPFTCISPVSGKEVTCICH
jgi:hypothetical protein